MAVITAIVRIPAGMFNISRGIMAATTGAVPMAGMAIEIQRGGIGRYTAETVTDSRGESAGYLRSAGRGQFVP